LCLLGGAVEAQEAPLVGDRPGFTDSASVLEPRRVQLETGYTHTEADEVESEAVGELLLRIGWTEKLELRLGFNSYVTTDTPAGEISGFEDPSIGIRLKLSEGAERFHLFKPEAALLLGTSLPIGAEEFGSPHFQPTTKLSLAWALGDRLSLGSNLGVGWISADGDQYLEGVASLSLGVAVTGSLGAFIEYYAYLPESSAGSADQYVDAGLAWVVTNDLQLDIRAGTQVGAGETDFFVGAGVAYRW
jgi:hypothetical protein